MKERRSSKVKGERVPPVGASAEQSHDDISLRGPSAKSTKSGKKPASGKPDSNIIEEVQITKLNLQGQLQAQAQKPDNSIDFSSLPPIAK